MAQPIIEVKAKMGNNFAISLFIHFRLLFSTQNINAGINILR
ncbi:hypothetical protein [Epilithonimonas sp.]|nr:hypothetical protein [Epilithonimonas sp.]